MTRTLRSIGLIASCLIWSAGAAAQSTPATSSQQPSSASTDSATRPATNTFFGDTGIWFVPTAEILPDKKWSVSGYRRGTNFVQGYSNVGDFAGTFGVGIKNRAEIFGSLIFDTRIDRDLRPLFGVEPDFGGIIDRYPRVNQVLDRRQYRRLLSGREVQHPVGISPAGGGPRARARWSSCRRAMMMRWAAAPTGRSMSLRAKKRSALSRSRGIWGGASIAVPKGSTRRTAEFRYGAGAAFPSRSPLRVSGELTGRAPVDNNVEIQNPPLVGIDGSIAPINSNVENLTRWTVGPHLPGEERLFRRRRVERDDADAGPLTQSHGGRRQRPDGGLLGLAGADRVSPGRAHLRAAAAAAAPAAASAAGPGAATQLDGDGDVHAEHGGAGRDVELHGDAACPPSTARSPTGGPRQAGRWRRRRNGRRAGRRGTRRARCR